LPASCQCPADSFLVALPTPRPDQGGRFAGSGYSTIAECAQTSTPVCAIARGDFAESNVIERFVTEQMNGTVLNLPHFLDGSWLKRIPQLINKTRPAMPSNGAELVAALIAKLLT